MNGWFVTFYLLLTFQKLIVATGISNKIVRLYSEGLYKPFTGFINISFCFGQYPSAWKLANVLPLFKKDNSHLKTNYGPVSLFLCLSTDLRESGFFSSF